MMITLKKVCLLFLARYVFVFSFIALTLFFSELYFPDFLNYANDITVNAVFFSVIAWLVLFILWLKFYEKDNFHFIKEKPSSKALVTGLVMVGVYEFYTTIALIYSDKAPHMFLQSNFALMYIFSSVILAPVSEELFYRYYLFSGLLKRYGALKSGLFVSFLFAMGHFTILNLDIIAQLPSFAGFFVFGGLMTFVYHKTQNLWYPIGFHALHNLIRSIDFDVILN